MKKFLVLILVICVVSGCTSSTDKSSKDVEVAETDGITPEDVNGKLDNQEEQRSSPTEDTETATNSIEGMSLKDLFDDRCFGEFVYHEINGMDFLGDYFRTTFYSDFLSSAEKKVLPILDSEELDDISTQFSITYFSYDTQDMIDGVTYQVTNSIVNINTITKQLKFEDQIIDVNVWVYEEDNYDLYARFLDQEELLGPRAYIEDNLVYTSDIFYEVSQGELSDEVIQQLENARQVLIEFMLANKPQFERLEIIEL